MRRILFVGNPDNELLKNLAIELKKIDTTLEIDLLSEKPFSNLSITAVYSKIYTPQSASRWMHISIVKFFAIWYVLFKQIGRITNRYDVVHVFYVTPVLGLLRVKMRTLSPKIFVSIFGSEFYRSGKILRILVNRFICRADLITAANESTLNDLLNYFKLTNIPVKVIPFGVKTLDVINSITPDKLKSIQLKLGIDSRKINIAVGYNGLPIQQHEAILLGLEESGLLRRNDLCFIFQLHGSRETTYQLKIIEKIKQSVSNFLIIDNFLSDEELAATRMSVDVMIQLQATDQLSASMLEYMYSGAVVITGAWLPYEMLARKQFYFFQIPFINEVAAILNNILTNLQNEKTLTIVNKEKVWLLTNWKIKSNQWYSLYTE
jgi:glycosyltransferase involved in cell wall biosynthesis